MVPWIKHLLCRHENLSSDPLTYVNAGWALQLTYNFSAQKGRTADPWTSWLTRLATVAGSELKCEALPRHKAAIDDRKHLEPP